MTRKLRPPRCNPPRNRRLLDCLRILLAPTRLVVSYKASANTNNAFFKQATTWKSSAGRPLRFFSTSSCHLVLLSCWSCSL